MTQRPELMKVALPAVGVMDMLRHLQSGAGWAYDYGTAQDSQGFKYIKGYPVHNVKAGTISSDYGNNGRS
jgi:prolyl oligopeptidase